MFNFSVRGRAGAAFRSHNRHEYRNTVKLAVLSIILRLMQNRLQIVTAPVVRR